MSNPSSSHVSAKKHNVKEPSCSHLRIFAPKDLSQNRRVDSEYCCAYAHSSTTNRCTVTTILIRKRDYFCTVQAGANCHIAQQGNRTELSEQPPTVTRSQHPFEDAEGLFQQLEAFSKLCSTCQLIYYNLPAKGLLHYVANNSASALSAVLHEIDEQHVDVQSRIMLTAFFAATLRGQKCGLPDAAVCGGEARPSSPCRADAKASIGAANKLLLQKSQNQVAIILHRCAGICLAVMLLMHQNECLDGVWQAAAYVAKHAVEEQIQWLMGAPAGLKLHLGLSQFLGSVGKLWLSYSVSAYSFINRAVMASLIGVIAAVGVIGGLTMQLALVCDLLHILALPVLFAYVAYTKLYALQLHYTLLMWRLMRGNRDALAVLRKQYGLEASPRKNHRHHDVKAQDAPALEQIIVGVLLFTPLVFLLPTTAVYYALALLLHTAVLAACRGLEVLVQLGQTIPLYTLWCWAVKPGMMPGTLMFISRPDLQAFMTCTTRGQLTVLEMVNQRSQLSMHIVQWFTLVYASNTKRLSISKGLQDVIMGRLVGFGTSNMHVRKLFERK